MAKISDKFRRRGNETPVATGDDTRVDVGMFGLKDAHMSGWFDGDQLFRGMEITADDVVVDVGCGEGGNLAFCAARGGHIIGIDLDAEALATAQTKVAEAGPKSMEFHVAPAEHLPVADGVATRVICTEVLEHVDDPAVVLRELYRIGAPGAIYLIAVPDEVQETMQKEVAFDYYFSAPNHIRIIGREELPQWVSDAGLEVVSQSGYGFFWSIWWAMLWGTGLDPERPWLISVSEIDNPALNHWTKAWSELIKTPEGQRVKEGLERFMPKSQVIIARKPE